MAKKTSFWDDIYDVNENVWGRNADGMLREYSKIIPVGKVLDIGAGEGRNALYFGSLGFEVEGSDISEKAVQRCLENAKNAGINADFYVSDLKKIKLKSNQYSLVICSSVLQFFNEGQREKIISEVYNSLCPGGFVYLNVFTTSDSSYKMYKKEKMEMIEKNTFCFPNSKEIVHYFDRIEIEKIFKSFTHVAISDGKYLDESHEGYNGLCHYLGRKA